MLACRHWHRLGERCEYCGHITTPARFYLDDANQPTLSQDQAEGAYLSWLETNIPSLFAQLSRVTKLRDESRRPVTKVSHVTKLGRPKTHESHAERQAAYRGRHANSDP